MTPMDYSLLGDLELCALLRAEDAGAWRYVLMVITEQEERSPINNRKRNDWNVPLESLIGQLYEEMVGKHKLDLYRGSGSLIGWLRSFLRGYLNRQNPLSRREQPVLDAPVSGDGGEGGETMIDEIPSSVSGRGVVSAYGDEDLRMLRDEEWKIVQDCFGELWKGNGVQAYVLLLKLRFHMSSLEIMKRLGISSEANVDQLFSRAVRKMRELKVKYEH